MTRTDIAALRALHRDARALPGTSTRAALDALSGIVDALPDLLDELDALREALPVDPWVRSPRNDVWNFWCYSCDEHRDDGHAPDCAWSKAMALRGEG